MQELLDDENMNPLEKAEKIIDALLESEDVTICGEAGAYLEHVSSLIHNARKLNLTVVIDGGLVQSVISHNKALQGLPVAIVDYDTDGTPDDELSEIVQDDGKTVFAYLRQDEIEPAGIRHEFDEQKGIKAMSMHSKSFEPVTIKNIWDRDSNKAVFIRAYLECALWSTIDENDDMGASLDANHDIDSFAPETLEKAIDDCEGFLKLFYDTILSLSNMPEYKNYNFENAGYDFWLSRNGHGAGFWDRDLGESGEKMTNACGWKTDFPEVNLYSENGVIHGY